MSAVRQAIHIFRKDVRHRWPYAAAVLPLTALHAWLSCRDALHGPTSDGPLLQFLISVLWSFATVSVVHGECLAGDRQFWVTRSYSWKSLLAAKLLFLAALAGLPIFVSDCVILCANAFNPLLLIPGLILRQCWLAAVLALAFALAALTPTIADFLGAVLAFLAISLLEALLIGPRIGRLAPAPQGVLDGAQWLLPVAALSLAVWQYARHRTRLVRVVALSLAPLAALWTVPAMVGPAGSAVPYDPRFQSVTVKLDLGRRQAFAEGIDGRIHIPVTIGGWTKELVECESPDRAQDARSAYCEPPGPDGSSWLVVDPAPWLPTEGELSLPINVNVYDQQPSVKLPDNGGWVRVPGFGGVGLREDAGGEVLMARTALKPAGPEWTYRLGGRTEDGSWRPPRGDNGPSRPTPLAFRYSSVCLEESRVPGDSKLPRPVVFTARRHVAVVYRELKIANSQLPDKAWRKR
jgi:hypothetical protein